MPTRTEKIDSREWTTGERPSVTMHYVPDGTSDDLTAKTLLLSSTPTLQSYGDGAAIVKVPVAVYIEKVYEEGDFAGLGIGT
ncbi:MAG: hypothetical protein AMJ81_12365 [Phycisphaerae bacterium SM23_33]|nr:MAG: hypothetical protein AMJ81_12365 [Phycisphaerae bacterium SM23_33]